MGPEFLFLLGMLDSEDEEEEEKAAREAEQAYDDYWPDPGDEAFDDQEDQ
jgi:hypothetical protein